MERIPDRAAEAEAVAVPAQATGSPAARTAAAQLLTLQRAAGRVHEGDGRRLKASAYRRAVEILGKKRRGKT